MSQQFEQDLVLALIAEAPESITAQAVSKALSMSLARTRVRIRALDEELLVEELDTGYAATDAGLDQVVEGNLDRQLDKYLAAQQGSGA